MITRKIIKTNDGSSSILINEWGETYHSIHGALQEALHVYIKNGCLLHTNQHLDILEMGFGTGLNFCLTLSNCSESNKSFNYVGVEGFPLEKPEWENLDYASFLNTSQVNFNKIHQLEWNKTHKIGKENTLTKVKSLFEDFESTQTFDVIYFDAFAYNYQPELWGEVILNKMRNLLNPNGFLTTYACKGVINRTFKSLGFRVEKVPGPKGKREITIAHKE